MEFNTVNQVLNDFIQELTTEYERQFQGHSINVEIIQDGNDLRVSITGPDEYYFIVHGRSKGAFPPPESLHQWIKKNLGEHELPKVKQLAYLIGRKISREGTQPHQEFIDFYNDLIRKYEQLIIEAENADAEAEFSRIQSELTDSLSQIL